MRNAARACRPGLRPVAVRHRRCFLLRADPQPIDDLRDAGRRRGGADRCIVLGQRIDLALERHDSAVHFDGDARSFAVRVPGERRHDLVPDPLAVDGGAHRDLVRHTPHARQWFDGALRRPGLVQPADFAAERDPAVLDPAKLGQLRPPLLIALKSARAEGALRARKMAARARARMRDAVRAGPDEPRAERRLPHGSTIR